MGAGVTAFESLAKSPSSQSEDEDTLTYLRWLIFEAATCPMMFFSLP